MSYIYFMELHQLLDAKIAAAIDSMKDAAQDSPAAKFHEGRIDILITVKHFLAERLTGKLPRGVRKQYLAADGDGHCSRDA